MHINIYHTYIHNYLLSHIGAISKKIGVNGVLTWSLVSYVLRFFIYASIKNPWQVREGRRERRREGGYVKKRDNNFKNMNIHGYVYLSTLKLFPYILCRLFLLNYLYIPLFFYILSYCYSYIHAHIISHSPPSLPPTPIIKYILF